MARKLQSAAQTIDGAATAPQAEPDDGAADLSVMLPDLTFTLDGREVTVREYRFVGGLEARAKGKPLIDALAEMMRSRAALDATVEDYMDLLVLHRDLVRELMAMSIVGADADWIGSLDGPDGETLLLNWWGVCGRFFVRIAMRKVLAETQRDLAKMAKTASAGRTSSASSPPPTTASPPSSNATTPSVN